MAFQIQNFPVWFQFLIMFLLADFIQWSIHIQLHKQLWLWKFHKVHHSIKEMGFSAQFRFHFMDAIIYKEGLCSPSALIRFGIQEFFIVHMFGVFVGHLNRAKVGWDYGPLRYVFNNPKMPIWHHSKVSPQDHPHGMNFGLSFSVCDYILGTAHVPKREKIMSSVLKTTKNILKIF